MKLNQYELKNKNILITGGTGFIGKRVVRQLVELGAKCYVITRQKYEDLDQVKYIQQDLSNIQIKDILGVLSEGEKFDYAIYLAANIPQIGMKKETYLEAKCSTLDPVVEFCEVVMPYINYFVYASSIDVVGAPQKQYYTEDDQVQPNTPYALAKYCGEFYVQSICKANNVGVTMLRFSQVYGPHEPIVRIIPILLNTLREDKKFNLYTTGEEKRRFVYVEDAATSVIKACITKQEGVFNIAGKSIESMNELLSIATQVYNKDLKINKVGQVEGVDNVPDISRATEVLAFEPKYTLYDGIQEIKRVEEEQTND